MWIGKKTVWAHNFYYRLGYVEGPICVDFSYIKRKA